MCRKCHVKKCICENRYPFEGAVFTQTNAAPIDENGNKQFNGVMMYHRYPDGTLKLVAGSPFLTPGQGVGQGNFPANDPLGSQNSIVVDKKNQYLYVTNAGSNEVSVFKIHHLGLIHLQTLSSGGNFPVSLAIRDRMLYVLNAAGYINFQGFKICKNGKLIPTQNCALQPPLNYLPTLVNPDTGIQTLQPQTSISPSQIGVSPCGRHLIIVRKEGFACPNPSNFDDFSCISNVAGTGRIDVYALDKKLRIIDCQNPTSNINTRSPAGRMPFGFVFSKTGRLIVGEFLGTDNSDVTPLDASALTSYYLKNDGTLNVISADVPPVDEFDLNMGGLCWTVRYCDFIYGTNTVNATVSLYKVDAVGNLKLINPTAADMTVIDSKADALDATITSDGRYYYQLSPNNGKIYAFSINKLDGSLTYIGEVDNGESLTGQSGLVTCSFKC